MRLIIFGSTGSVGRLLVEQALQDNHLVTAFLRDPGKTYRQSFKPQDNSR